MSFNQVLYISLVAALFMLVTMMNVEGSNTTYQLETGVHYGGWDIGSCGSYNTRTELEAACTADSNCVGYSTINRNMGGIPENGFYPWCLKRTEDRRTVDATHNYYRKIVDSDGTDNNGPCASLYEHKNYGGWREDVDMGEGNILHRNDHVSSVKVRQGCTLNAYRHINFKDMMFSVTEDVSKLHREDNDHMTSYRCYCGERPYYSEPCVTLYEHSNYRGWKKEIEEATQGTLYGKNDMVSSFIVKRYCTFKAYRHSGTYDLMFTAGRWTDSDYPEYGYRKSILRGAQNDHMTSFSCEC